MASEPLCVVELILKDKVVEMEEFFFSKLTVENRLKELYKNLAVSRGKYDTNAFVYQKVELSPRWWHGLWVWLRSWGTAGCGRTLCPEYQLDITVSHRAVGP